MSMNKSHISLIMQKSVNSFTGSNLSIRGSTTKGVDSIPAFSGKAGKYEPIPPGDYWIQTDEIFEIGVTTDLSTKLAAIALGKSGSFFESCIKHMQAWGSYRIPIRQLASQEKATGRNAMFIHGGEVYGSAGCIDLQHWMDWFVKFLLDEHQGKEPQRIILHVR